MVFEPSHLPSDQGDAPIMISISGAGETALCLQI